MSQTLIALTPEELEALVERGVRRALEQRPDAPNRAIAPKPRKRARPQHNPAKAVTVDDISRARARRALRRHGL